MDQDAQEVKFEEALCNKVLRVVKARANGIAECGLRITELKYMVHLLRHTCHDV